MEDSLKGILITTVILGLFTTAIINFIFLFPKEQGFDVTINNSKKYAELKKIQELNTKSHVESGINSTEGAYNQWDITEGFMGSNQLKNSQTDIKSMLSNTFSNFILLSSFLFGQDSPFTLALTVLSSLSLAYLLYLLIKWVRSGQ